MTGQHWIELLLFLTLLTLLTKPLGIYIFKVLEPTEKTFLDVLLKPLENATYRLAKIDTTREQTWKEYALSILYFSLVSGVVTFLFLLLQTYLPLNYSEAPKIPSLLNTNITVSYLTNTGLHCFIAEKTLSYFSQMVPLTLQSFLSPAIGLAGAAALTRGIARYSKKTLGNFWVDLIRISYYLLLPLALLVSLVFVIDGVPQNFKPPTVVHTLESGAEQTIIQGPIASRDSIKILGTNGGSYTNANSAHPYENPTPFSNLLQALLLLAIPAAQTYYFGKKVKNRRHGWCLYFTMLIIFTIGVVLTTQFEMMANPQFADLNIEKNVGNLEGKEVRFNIFSTALFTTATTAASNGATNAQMDCFTPLGSLAPLLNIQLGEVVFGGVGAGLYNILLFALFTVFAVGLIIGRTPEYLGNKILALDIKLVLLALIAFIINVLGFTTWAAMTQWGTEATTNLGPHGFTEILYTFSSAGGNNGSTFSGLDLSSPWYLITTGASMLLGRFLALIPILALAGSLVNKKRTPPSIESFPVSGFTFVALLIMSILLIGALSFLPSLVLGPILEQFYMHYLTLF